MLHRRRYTVHSDIHKYIKHTLACPWRDVASTLHALIQPCSLRSRPHLPESRTSSTLHALPQGSRALICVYQPWGTLEWPRVTWCKLMQFSTGKPQDGDGRCGVMVKGMLIAESFWVRGRTKWHWKALCQDCMVWIMGFLLSFIRFACHVSWWNASIFSPKREWMLDKCITLNSNTHFKMFLICSSLENKQILKAARFCGWIYFKGIQTDLNTWQFHLAVCIQKGLTACISLR